MNKNYYEEPRFTPAEMLALTGVAERRLQVWIQRGFVPRADRPGRGFHRAYGLAEILYPRYMRTLTEAHVPLEEAAFYASGVFPALAGQVPLEVAEIMGATDRPDRAPRLFQVFRDGEAPELLKWKAIRPGQERTLITDLTHVILIIVNGAKAILDRRTAPAKQSTSLQAGPFI